MVLRAQRKPNTTLGLREQLKSAVVLCSAVDTTSAAYPRIG